MTSKSFIFLFIDFKQRVNNSAYSIENDAAPAAGQVVWSIIVEAA